MKKLAIFFRFIRWPNLLFIALTQVLFYCFIFPFAYHSVKLDTQSIFLQPSAFLWIVLSSVFIAAAGYIINDYFDVNIDMVNKGEKIIVGKYVNRRTAILLHAALSLAGMLCIAYAGYQLKNIYLPFFNLFSVLLLLFYSTTFKRKLLIGNLVISALTAWVILILPVAEYRLDMRNHGAWQLILKYAIIYGGFAFIISMIREVVKDMEDAEGDLRYGCTTMPVVWGIPASKVFAGVWIVVLAGMVIALVFYILTFGRWLVFLYAVVCIVLPLGYVLRQLFTAMTPADFHRLSSKVKLIMLSGILSMLFFIFI